MKLKKLLAVMIASAMLCGCSFGGVNTGAGTAAENSKTEQKENDQADADSTEDTASAQESNTPADIVKPSVENDTAAPEENAQTEGSETSSIEDIVTDTTESVISSASRLDSTPELQGETSNTKGDSDIVSTLTPETEEKLAQMVDDYAKIKWGVRYAPFKEIPDVVFSLAPYVDRFGKYNLILAITNLTPYEVTISGNGAPKNMDGTYSEASYFFADSIGSGNTYIRQMPCSGVPTGEVHWEDLTSDTAYRRFVPWEADWEIRSGKNCVLLNYNIYANEPFKAGDVFGLVVDSFGNIVDTFNIFESEVTSNLTGSIKSFTDYSAINASDLAFFVNPTTEK